MSMLGGEDDEKMALVMKINAAAAAARDGKMDANGTERVDSSEDDGKDAIVRDLLMSVSWGGGCKRLSCP